LTNRVPDERPFASDMPTASDAATTDFAKTAVVLPMFAFVSLDSSSVVCS
jgi:hypothetical protein